MYRVCSTFCGSRTGLDGLILRLGLGIVILPHGLQKVFGWFGGQGLTATYDSFTEGMGIPGVLAILVIAAESVGSLALIVGFMTRLAAFGIVCVMTGAIAIVHWQYGFFMNWQGQKEGEGFEFHILAIAIGLALLIAGGGLWSVDSAIVRRCHKGRRVDRHDVRGPHEAEGPAVM